MNTAQLQAALNARAPSPHLATDGIAGRNTMRAVDALVAPCVDRILFVRWPDARRMVAAEQIIMRDAGIETGRIDGLVGEQTRYARTVYAARQANGGKPDAAIESWRDQEAPAAPSGAGTAIIAKRNQWPRQRDVAEFYGAPGTNHAKLELPYPMRIAWEPSQLVSRFDCHAMVKEPLRRIFTAALKHYGHERIVELRLDMFGGCYNNRNMKGSSRKSMHAYACAVDIDPDRNQLKFHRAQATLDDPPYNAWWDFVYAEGALSLGRERDYDWMHFQFTRDFS